jgi:hypothetical protein
VDREGDFHAFVHAPLKEDAERERNATSVALKVTVFDGEAAGRAILFGDLHYETLKRVFDAGDEDSLEWNVFLAPHHCSDSAMFVADEEGVERALNQEIMDAFAAAGSSPTYVISSSVEFPPATTPATTRLTCGRGVEYEKITERFECTGEWPDADEPKPIVFHFVEGDFAMREGETTSARALTTATAAARGDTQTPGQRHGYGTR